VGPRKSTTRVVELEPYSCTQLPAWRTLQQEVWKLGKLWPKALIDAAGSRGRGVPAAELLSHQSTGRVGTSRGAKMLRLALRSGARSTRAAAPRRHMSTVPSPTASAEASLQPPKQYSAGDKRLMDAQYTEDIGYMFGERVRAQHPPSTSPSTPTLVCAGAHWC
jgi:hypothetical protein